MDRAGRANYAAPSVMFPAVVIGGPPEVARIVARTCGRLGIEVPGRDVDGDLEGPAERADPGLVAADSAVHPGGARGQEREDLVRLAEETGARFIGCDAETLARLESPASFRALVEQVGLEREYAPDEDLIGDARRIEVVVARDGAGEAYAVGNRETSIGDASSERAWIRECPAPHLVFLGEGEALGGALADAAIRLAGAAGLRGIGVFDFAVDRLGQIHCLGARVGMETAQGDLDLVFGVDLVETELRCFVDEGLPEDLANERRSGACIVAEIRALGPGTVETLRFPPTPASRVRIEVGARVGNRVEPGHVLASLIAHGPVRHRAVHLLDRVLAETVVGSVPNNLRLIRAALDDASFRAGQYDVGFGLRFETEPPAA